MPNYNENIIFEYQDSIENPQKVYPRIRTKAKELALLMRELCPPGRELAVARTKLEEVVHWANAAIARQPAYLDEAKRTREGTLEEAIAAEEERVKAVRAAHPGAKNQTVG